MTLNPYSAHLGAQNAVEILRTTVRRITELMATMQPDELKLRTPAEPWNAREIVAHLADCDVVFGWRLRQTLAEDASVVQPFDQDRWARRYANCDAESALALFAAMRRWNLLLIEGASEEERAREMTHPERGTMSFWTVVETMAGHDVNHLARLEELARR